MWISKKKLQELMDNGATCAESLNASTDLISAASKQITDLQRDLSIAERSSEQYREKLEKTEEALDLLKQEVFVALQEYQDESLHQGLEFKCSIKTFRAIIDDLKIYLGETLK